MKGDDIHSQDVQQFKRKVENPYVKLHRFRYKFNKFKI